MTKVPASLTYSSVVSRDSVLIALTLAALNDLQVMSCDKQNKYLTDTFLTKIPIAPCYCRMMGQTLKEEIRITQYNNPTKAGKYSLEDLFRASDNIPHHYRKF